MNDKTVEKLTEYFTENPAEAVKVAQSITEYNGAYEWAQLLTLADICENKNKDVYKIACQMIKLKPENTSTMFYYDSNGELNIATQADLEEFAMDDLDDIIREIDSIPVSYLSLSSDVVDIIESEDEDEEEDAV